MINMLLNNENQALLAAFGQLAAFAGTCFFMAKCSKFLPKDGKAERCGNYFYSYVYGGLSYFHAY